MRIASGETDKYIYFVALNAADLTQRMTGLNNFTVYRSRNGAAAVAMTTPTINEVDGSNMPGVYELLVDEDTDISGEDSEEIIFHITGDDGGGGNMAPVSRSIELYTPSAGGGGLDAAGVRDAVGLASANLDTQLGAIPTLGELQTELGNLNDPTTSQIAAAVWGESVNSYFTEATFGFMMRGMVIRNAAVGSSGNDTTHVHLPNMDTYSDDELNGLTLVIYDSSTGEFHARTIRSFANSGDLAEVDTLPFTPTTGDSYWIMPAATNVGASSGGGATAQEVWEYATRELTALDEDNTTLDLDATIQAANDARFDAVDSAIDGLNDLDAAAIRTAVGLASANLDTQLGDIPTNSELATALGNLNDLDAAGIRTAIGMASADLDTQLDAIAADTGELQTDWADGGRLDLILDARASQSSVDDIPTNAELSSALAAADDAVLAVLSTVDSNVDSIMADTNELQTDWADGGRLDLILDARASQSSVDDVPTNAELAAALASADDAVLAAIGDLNNLDAAGIRSAVGLASANLDAQFAALPTASENADAVAAMEIETGMTLLQSMRGFASIMMAPWSEAAGVYTWRDVNNTKDRVVATVGDTSRGAPTLDLD